MHEVRHHAAGAEEEPRTEPQRLETRCLLHLNPAVVPPDPGGTHVDVSVGLVAGLLCQLGRGEAGFGEGTRGAAPPEVRAEVVPVGVVRLGSGTLRGRGAARELAVPFQAALACGHLAPAVLRIAYGPGGAATSVTISLAT